MLHYRHSHMHLFRHPHMLLSGDLLKILVELSQTVREIPDKYYVFSGMTGWGRPG